MTCWFSQIAAVVTQARDKRLSIAGLMPARPLTMADNDFRLVPRDWAAFSLYLF
jgi:hypothetical protein